MKANRSPPVSTAARFQDEHSLKKNINNNGQVQKRDSTETRADHSVLETGGTPDTLAGLG
jgi:hypothetical protein